MRLNTLSTQFSPQVVQAIRDGRVDIGDTVLFWSAEERRLSLRLLKLRVKGADGNIAADRRLGTFYLDGNPLQAFRVNGELHKDGVSLAIDWDNPNQKYDAEGPPVRLKFASADKDRLAGKGATAVRLKSKQAFDGKTPFADFPENAKD